MFCKNCGKELPDGSLFCPECGADLRESSETVQPTENAAQEYVPYEEYPGTEPAAETAAAEPVYTAEPVFAAVPEEPAPKKKGWIAAVIAAVVVIGGAVACFALGVFSNPKADLAKAVANTMSEYNTAMENSVLPACMEISRSETKNASVSLGLRSVTGEDVFSGLGLTVAFSSDPEKEKADLALTPFYGSADMTTIALAADGTNVFVGSADFLGGKYAGLNTLTIGEDLKSQWGVDGFEDISFNVFELIKSAKEARMTPDAVKEKLEPSVKALTDAITVEKVGKITVEVNDEDVDAVSYTALIPAEELNSLIDEYADLMLEVADSFDPVEILTSMGFSAGFIEENFGDISPDYSDFEDAIDEIKDYIEDNEGLTLTCAVADGYLRTVGFEIDEDEAAFLFEFGTKAAIADAFRMTLTVDDGKDDAVLVLESVGDHTASGSPYLDELTLTITEFGEKQKMLAATTEYDAKTGEFSWKASLLDDEYRVSLTGDLTVSEKELVFADGVLRMTEEDEELIELSVDADMSTAYQQLAAADASDYYSFSDMTPEDWDAVVSELYMDLISFVQGLDSDLVNMVTMFL